jgi:glycosyltransferase involved in cell wall biosynthesis
MRILFVSAIPPADPSGGAERVVDRLATQLADDHEVTVFSAADTTTTEQTPAGYEQVTIPTPNVYRPDRRDEHGLGTQWAWQGLELFSPTAQGRVEEALAGLGPFDVVNTHNYAGFTLPALAAFADHGEALVHTAHDYRLLSPWVRIWDGPFAVDAWPLALYRRRTRSLLAPVDRFVVPSRFAGRLHERFAAFAGTPWTVIPNGVRVDRFTPQPAPEQPTFLLFGRLDEAKGIRAFLEAVADRNEGARFRVAGGGPDAEAIEALSREHPGVTYLGYLDRTELEAEIAASTGVVVPSQWQEVFGLVAAEAMAAGVPPLYTPVGGLPEVAGSGLGIELPADLDRAAQRVLDLARDPHVLHRMREGCRAYAEKALTVERMARGYEKLFRDAV